MLLKGARFPADFTVDGAVIQRLLRPTDKKPV